MERPRYAAARFEAERYRKAGLVGRDEPGPGCCRPGPTCGGRRPGGPAAFLVAGEAGIGKSRLVAEVLDRVEASGGRVLGVGVPALLRQRLAVAGGPAARPHARRGRATTPTGSARLVAHLTRSGWTRRGRSRSSPRSSGCPPTPEYPAPRTGPERLPRRDARPAGGVGGRARARRAAPARGRGPALGRSVHAGLLGRLVDRGSGRPAHRGHHPRRSASRGGTPSTSSGSAGSTVGRRQLIDNLVAGQALAGDRRAAVLAQAEGIPLFIEELTRSTSTTPAADPLPLRVAGAVHLAAEGAGRRPAGRPGRRHRRPVLRRRPSSPRCSGTPTPSPEQLELLVEEGIIEPLGGTAGHLPLPPLR